MVADFYNQHFVQYCVDLYISSISFEIFLYGKIVGLWRTLMIGPVGFFIKVGLVLKGKTVGSHGGMKSR